MRKGREVVRERRRGEGKVNKRVGGRERKGERAKKWMQALKTLRVDATLSNIQKLKKVFAFFSKMKPNRVFSKMKTEADLKKISSKFEIYLLT